jgi:hypothetical protein
MTAEDRKYFEKELEARQNMIEKFSGKENGFAIAHAAMVAGFKKGSNNLTVGEANAKRTCYVCKIGFFLDVDGQCKTADPLDNCDKFSVKSKCSQCSPGYWLTQKTDDVKTCEEAGYWLRQSNCYYWGSYAKNTRPQCVQCDRGFVLRNNLCVPASQNDAAIYSWNSNQQQYVGCNTYFNAYSIGVTNWDNNQQICVYPWFKAPYTIHLFVTVILLIALTVFLVIKFNTDQNISFSKGGSKTEENSAFTADETNLTVPDQSNNDIPLDQGTGENNALTQPLNPSPVEEAKPEIEVTN